MRIQDELDQLSQIVAADKIGDLSKEDLERYANALCFSFASDHFGKHQFSQVCETIRLLLIKKYTEDMDKQNTEIQANNLKLQEQNVNLQSQNNRLQKLIIFLMVLTITMAGLQIYVMLRPNQQLQQQTELLKAISSQQKVAPTVQPTAQIQYDSPQKKPLNTETRQ
jgi:hypothetical protein